MLQRSRRLRHPSESGNQEFLDPRFCPGPRSGARGGDEPKYVTVFGPSSTKALLQISRITMRLFSLRVASRYVVIPAQAEIQKRLHLESILDSRERGNDALEAPRREALKTLHRDGYFVTDPSIIGYHIRLLQKSLTVIPAKAGIQSFQEVLDPGFAGMTA